MKRIPRLSSWIVVTALFFLVLMSLLRVLNWTIFHIPGQDLNLLETFWLGLRYDARIVSVLAVLMLLLGSIPALDPFIKKAGRITGLGLVQFFCILLVFFYVIDFLHYKYLAQRLNASALSFLQDAGISGRMLWQTYPVIRIFVGMIIVLLVLFYVTRFIYRLASKRKPVIDFRRRLAGFLFIFFIAAFLIFGRASQFPLRWSDAFNLGSDFNANLALNPFQSFFSSLSFRSSGYDLAKVKQAYPLMSTYLGVDHPNSATLNYLRTKAADSAGAARKPNIVLVICESFSAYKSSMWGNPLNTTPFFNSLCQQGIFFDNCFTPHFGTARGVWANITGLPDVELVKTASRNPAMVDQQTIINDFAGYEKYYFLGGSTSWANIRGLLTNNIRGLHLYEENSYDVPKVDVWGISDKNLFLQANKILAKEQQPFFAIIQTADNHRPYTIPLEDQQQFKSITVSKDSLNRFGFESNEELNAFRYTDFSYRQFMTAAQQSPYFAHTIFAFVGDHGIGGNAAQMFPPAWTKNGLTAYHVPMLFYSPALLKPARYHAVASQVDMLPTLAGLAGISYHDNAIGRDLLSSLKKDSGASNVAFIMDHNDNSIGMVKGNWYYSRNKDGKQESFVWADYRHPERPQDSATALERYRELTNAFFETTRYLLLNNRKTK